MKNFIVNNITPKSMSFLEAELSRRETNRFNSSNFERIKKLGKKEKRKKTR